MLMVANYRFFPAPWRSCSKKKRGNRGILLELMSFTLKITSRAPSVWRRRGRSSPWALWIPNQSQEPSKKKRDKSHDRCDGTSQVSSGLTWLQLVFLRAALQWQIPYRVPAVLVWLITIFVNSSSPRHHNWQTMTSVTWSPSVKKLTYPTRYHTVSFV